jgi:hypothetical protein
MFSLVCYFINCSSGKPPVIIRNNIQTLKYIEQRPQIKPGEEFIEPIYIPTTARIEPYAPVRTSALELIRHHQPAQLSWNELQSHIERLDVCTLCTLAKNQATLSHSITRCPQMTNLCYVCFEDEVFQMHNKNQCRQKIKVRHCFKCLLPGDLHVGPIYMRGKSRV